MCSNWFLLCLKVFFVVSGDVSLFSRLLVPRVVFQLVGLRPEGSLDLCWLCVRRNFLIFVGLRPEEFRFLPALCI
ncbi:unnamed protein product [Arabidopsis halleri]